MLNMTLYQITLRYIPTNRFRTITMRAHSEDEVMELLEYPEYDDYSEIKSISTLPEEPPTQKQINYASILGININENMCKKDVSALIDRKLSDPSDPNPGLVKFADEHNILFSKFAGKKALYDAVFSQLPTTDRLAFFIFSVYRYLSDDREANLDQSSHKPTFYRKANEWKDEPKIIHSMDYNYEGADLRFFGALLPPDGNIVRGGSRSTLIFKQTVGYLLRQRLITDTKEGTVELSQLKNISSPAIPAPDLPNDNLLSYAYLLKALMVIFLIYVILSGFI